MGRRKILVTFLILIFMLSLFLVSYNPNNQLSVNTSQNNHYPGQYESVKISFLDECQHPSQLTLHKTDYQYLIEKNVDLSYGIIVPIESTAYRPITRFQRSISNMINDLLRLNHSVYWSSTNFSVISQIFDEKLSGENSFEKGTFIVPFSGNLSVDSQIICIAADYFYTSEIEEYCPIQIYLLLEPITITAYPLEACKIAYHFGGAIPSQDLHPYLEVLRLGGFLDNHILLDDDISEKLNNNDFNLFIWPGGDPSYTKKITATAFNIKASQTIRSFIAKGGGYMGSCYGALVASSGIIAPVNLFQSFFPKLPSPIFLSIVTGSCIDPLFSGIATIEILNTSHPISYGVNPIQKTFHAGGPTYIWLGGKTKSLAVCTNISVYWLRPLAKYLSEEATEKLLNFTLGKPVWVTSLFGDGRVVAFGDHPEIPYPNRNDRIIHNAAFYTTAKQISPLTTSFAMPLEVITYVTNLTKQLNLPSHTPLFNIIWERIWNLTELSKKIDDNEKTIFSLKQDLRMVDKFEDILSPSLGAIYHDSYTRWLTDFSQSLITLERIYQQVVPYLNHSIQLVEWKDLMINELTNCSVIFLDILQFEKQVIENLKQLVGSSAEKISLSIIADQLDIELRKGYQHVIQLCLFTTKVYRELWYQYETKLSYTTNYNTTTGDEKPLYLSTIISVSNCTIFVDDDAPPGGNGTPLYPYCNIQDAIEAATDGDIIQVDRGIYYGSVIIDKSIRLIGSDKNQTIIDAKREPHHLVMVMAPSVEISGFTIRNSSLISCGICLYSNNNLIKDNILTNNCIGIGMFPGAKDNLIKNNVLFNNSYMGIAVDEFNQINNTISGNILRNNGCHGIYLVNSDNTLKDNIIMGKGLTIYPSEMNEFSLRIYNNSVNNKPICCYNDCQDLFISGEQGQIFLINCTNITIENLNISGLNEGIYIQNSKDISINHNIVENNNLGICVYSSKNVTISQNIFKNNSLSGIWLGFSENNIITRNNFHNNSDSILLSNSNKNQIYSNSIINNNCGVNIQSQSKENIIFGNNFILNHQNSYDKSNNKWDQNYWDDWLGLTYRFLRFTPYPIQGLPLRMNFDWYPQMEPYDIK